MLALNMTTTYDLECEFCNDVIEIIVPCGGKVGTIKEGVCGACTEGGKTLW